MNKYDVVALGELLVDFTEEGLSTQGINTDNLAEDPEVPTTLAFVHTKAMVTGAFPFTGIREQI